MPGAASNGGRFRVHCSTNIVRRLKEIQSQAKQEGRGGKVLSAIKHIWHQLENDPAEFGEPLHLLPALRLAVRHTAVEPLLVYFAVHETKPLVFIKQVTLLPESGI